MSERSPRRSSDSPGVGVSPKSLAIGRRKLRTHRSNAGRSAAATTVSWISGMRKEFGVLTLRETANAETLPDMPVAEMARRSLS